MDTTKLEELVKYFRKRAKENKNRVLKSSDVIDITWHGAKDDTYTRCADKLQKVIDELKSNSLPTG